MSVALVDADDPGACDPLDDPAFDGHELASGGGCDGAAAVVRAWRVGVEGRDAETASVRRVVFDFDDPAAADADGEVTGAADGEVADGFTASPTTASVSVTGRLPADGVEAADPAAGAKSAGCDCAATGAGTVVWRAAK